MIANIRVASSSILGRVSAAYMLGLESETDRGPYTEVGRQHYQEASARADDVASVDDPMKAWWNMIEQFQKAGRGSNAPEFLQMMLAPMQQQLDLIQKALETQAEFNRELTEQALAPMRQVLEGLKQAANTTRAAGEALKEAGDLLTQQATAMDQALSFSWPFLDITAPPSEGSAKAE
jgi:hypothetical protein